MPQEFEPFVRIAMSRKNGSRSFSEKLRALNELFHKARGTINTREKFEAKREELALHVWLEMKHNDSHECRNCHSYEAMDFHAQSLVAQRDMQKAMKQGKTCIDCHKGVAHTLTQRIRRRFNCFSGRFG